MRACSDNQFSLERLQIMKKLGKPLIFLAILPMVALSLYSVTAPAHGDGCRVGSVCSLNNCNGAIQADENGYPIGCVKAGPNCTGTCVRCNANTNGDYCVHTGNNSDECNWTHRDVARCGKKVPETCNGVWANKCGCTNVGTAGNDNCTFNFCS